MRQIWFMRYPVQQKKKDIKDEWGTSAREGYEDRGAFRPMRVAPRDPGSPVLRYLGGICIVGGMLWGTWLITQGGEIGLVLQQNRGPVALVALGLIASIVGKYVRF
jgi:hypothetical protein